MKSFSIINIFSSFRAGKCCGHLPLAAPRVIHIWLFQSLSTQNYDNVYKGRVGGVMEQLVVVIMNLISSYTFDT